MGLRDVRGLDGLGKISEICWKCVNEVGPRSLAGNTGFKYWTL
jgi:hypothetical protein